MLDNATSTFAVALFVSATVHATPAPGATVVCAQLTADSAAEVTSDREVLTVVPLRVAETRAVASAVNAPAFAVNVALEAPCAIDTLAGTVTCVLSLASATVVAVVAPAVRLTVQVAEALGARDVGVQETVDRAGELVGGFSVTSTAVCTPLHDAVICAFVLAVTADAVAVKFADALPAGTATDEGTVN